MSERAEAAARETATAIYGKAQSIVQIINDAINGAQNCTQADFTLSPDNPDRRPRG
jgi:hypothetical protein